MFSICDMHSVAWVASWDLHSAEVRVRHADVPHDEYNRVNVWLLRSLHQANAHSANNYTIRG